MTKRRMIANTIIVWVLKDCEGGFIVNGDYARLFPTRADARYFCKKEKHYTCMHKGVSIARVSMVEA
jgi:hypothetical protein